MAVTMAVTTPSDFILTFGLLASRPPRAPHQVRLEQLGWTEMPTAYDTLVEARAAQAPRAPNRSHPIASPT